MSRTMRRAALLLTLLRVVAGAVGASATDGRAGSNRLTGCRNTSTGVLDQVKTGLLPMGGDCGSGEVKVSWNKTGPEGPQGPTGATGATGAPGTPGANGVSGWELVVAVSANDSTETKVLNVACPAGKKVVGGGGYTSRTYDTLVIGSYPYLGGGGWNVVGHESIPTLYGWNLNGYAICVTALP